VAARSAPRRLRRPPRRARLRHDRVSQPGSNNRHRACRLSPATTREVLYVSATRGRESNSLYIDTSFDPDRPPVTTPRSHHRAREKCLPACSPMMARICLRTRRCAEYRAVQRTSPSSPSSTRRWPAPPRSNAGEPSWSTQVSTLFSSSRYVGARHAAHFSPLFETQRPAGSPVEGVFPKLVALRSLDDAEDPAAVMHARVERGHRQPGRSAERVPASSPGSSESARRHRSRHGPRPRGASCCHGTPGERARRCTPSSIARLGYSGSARRQ